MRYTTISYEDMRGLLTEKHGWNEVGQFGEHVLEWRLPFDQATVVKVYTSIRKADWRGRHKGTDAIRVALVDTRGQGRGLAKLPHVKRVDGWRGNLKARIMEAILTRIDQLHRQGHPPIVWPPKRPSIEVTDSGTFDQRDGPASQDPTPAESPKAERNDGRPREEDYPQTEEGQKSYLEDLHDWSYDPEGEAERQALGLAYGRYTPKER